LLQQIRGEVNQPVTTIVPTRLVERESVRKNGKLKKRIATREESKEGG
jgi:hypothetical protein